MCIYTYIPVYIYYIYKDIQFVLMRCLIRSRFVLPRILKRSRNLFSLDSKKDSIKTIQNPNAPINAARKHFFTDAWHGRQTDSLQFFKFVYCGQFHQCLQKTQREACFHQNSPHENIRTNHRRIQLDNE